MNKVLDLLIIICFGAYAFYTKNMDAAIISFGIANILLDTYELKYKKGN